jgi:hypothetical protein
VEVQKPSRRRKLSKHSQPMHAKPRPTLYVFDIETIAQPEDVLDRMMPAQLKEPRLPANLERPEIPVFRHAILEKSLKKAEDCNGEYKKGQKTVEQCRDEIEAWRSEKLAAFHEEHRAKIAKWESDSLSDKLKWIDSACLRAETAQIPLICSLNADRSITVIFIGTLAELDMKRIASVNRVDIKPCKDEGELLKAWWDYVSYVLGEDISAVFAGFNTSKFDLGLLNRRSWINRVPITVRTHKNRYPDSETWLDLMEVWQCGDRQMYISADTVAAALGVRGKTDHGGNFGAKWRESKTDGIIYCMNDVLCEGAIAEAMGYANE